MYIYLIHFHEPLHHAQHYIGITNNLDRREIEHRNGRGSRLLRIVSQLGIVWDIVRVWNVDDRAEASRMERTFKKKLKSARLLCPLCRQATLERKRQLERARV